MNARRFLRSVKTVARREFTTIVAQPTFLILLLSPFLVLMMSLVGGGAVDRAYNHGMSERNVAAIADGREAVMIRAVDARLRTLFDRQPHSTLVVVAPSSDPAGQARKLMASPHSEVVAVLYGPLDRPTILRMPDAQSDARYLAQVADQAVRSVQARDNAVSLGQPVATSSPDMRTASVSDAGATFEEATGATAVLLVFMATFLLCSNVVSGLAEERSSKIVDILASSAPLESVFLGKVLGALAVAALFVGFWLLMAVIGFSALVHMVEAADPGADAQMLGAETGGFYPVLVFVYFILNYLISSCTLIGLSSLASTPRASAIVTMPYTLALFGMMSLASYAAQHPGTPAFYAAAAIPYSSTLLMVARGATTPGLGQHAVAIAWQILCIAGIVRLSAAAFRSGAIGGERQPARRRRS
jgi:ABC-2 type transport system permease protein